jgi:hypothetical protein
VDKLNEDVMEHDPLCPWEGSGEWEVVSSLGWCDECVQIAGVREDEQAKAGDRVAAVFAGDWPGSPGYLSVLQHLRKSVIAAAMDDRDYTRWNKP